MRVVLENASVDFGGIHALKDVSLELVSGELVAVIGSSGAGKSTLFRVLTRSVGARGKVLLDGDDLYRMSRRELRRVRRSIGSIRQAYDLVPQLSAGMNASLGKVGNAGGLASLRLFASGPEDDLSLRTRDALAQVGLDDKYGTRTTSLSGGQQQRVAVARLLVQEPHLVLADEPVAAVDPVTSEKVLATLLDLNRRGATMAVNLHDVRLAKRFPRVLALKNGELVYDGSPSKLDDDVLRDIYSGDTKPTPTSKDSPRVEVGVVRGMDGISTH